MARKVDMDLTSAVLHEDADAVSDALSRGGNPNARLAENGTPLHLAVISGNLRTVDQLIGAGAELEACDCRGWTPLHWAAITNGNPKLIERLLAAGADINAHDGKGRTPLDCASAMGIPETAKALLKAGGKCSGRSRKWVHRAMADAASKRSHDRG